MTDEVVAAVTAAPESVTPEPEGQIEGQAAEPNAEAEGEEKKSRSAERRERDKAYRESLKQEREAAMAKATEAEGRKAKLLGAGSLDAEPSENDFPDPIELSAARAIWKADKRRVERFVQEAETEAAEARKQASAIDQKERQALRVSFEAQVEDAKSRYADYDAVARAPDVPVSDAMADLIITSDVGPDVLYHLGQNKAIAAQIAKLSPVEAARAIGRIEASLQAPKPRMETNAPAPINPVKGAVGASVKDPAKMSYAEFKAYRDAGGKL